MTQEVEKPLQTRLAERIAYIQSRNEAVKAEYAALQQQAQMVQARLVELDREFFGNSERLSELHDLLRKDESPLMLEAE
jgi:chromosome segregation ATPase